MRGSILLKTIRDKRWFVVGWGLGFIALTLLMVLFYPSMKTDGALESLVTNAPPAFQGLIGDLADLTHFSTYLASQLFDIRGTIFAGIVAIILAISLTVGDEDRGYVRTVVALSVSRSRLLIAKWLAMLIIMAGIVVAELVTIYLAAPLVDESVDGWWAVSLASGQWLVMVAIGSLVFAAGIGTGRRSLATTIGVVVVALGFILSTFAASVDWIDSLSFLSVYSYFPTVEVVKDGWQLQNLVVLVALVLLPTTVALLAFRRRDISS